METRAAVDVARIGGSKGAAIVVDEATVRVDIGPNIQTLQLLQVSLERVN